MEDKEHAHLGVLTQDQIRNIITLKNTYCEFWESVKFSKGWDAPVIEMNDVIHLLDEAAEIVVRIRTYLDANNPESERKYRVVDGNAKEYLWDLESRPKDEVFIRDLVHATLSTSNKYVEGLNAEKIGKLMKDIQQYNATHQTDKYYLEGRVLEDNILKIWNETDALLRATISEENKYWNASLIKDTQHLWNQIHTLKRRITLAQKKREFHKKRDDEHKELERQRLKQEEDEAKARAAENEEQKAQREAKEKKEAEAKAKEEAEQKRKQEEEERKRVESEKDREGLLKITQVAKKTAEIENELKEISDLTGKVKNIKPTEAMDKLSDLKKRCIKNSSKLMQDLLTLDELVGLHEARAAKKEQIAHIQTLLDNVENLKSRISSLELEIQPKVSQQKEDEKLDKIAEEELQHLLEEKVKNATKAKEETHQQTQKPPTTHAPPPTTHTTPPEKPTTHAPPPTTHTAPPEKSTTHAPPPSTHTAPPEKPTTHAPPPSKSETHQEKPPHKIETPVDNQSLDTRTIPLQKRNETVAHPRFDLRTAWSKLRLDPKVEVIEGEDSYTIMANVPGIHKDEIETVILPDGTLQISGVRVPTTEEIALMRRQIHSRFTPQSDEEEDMLVLRLGVGRFGRFEKRFQLPKGLNLEGIQGQYKDGAVLITVPKPKSARPKQRNYPYNAYPFSPFMSEVPFWS
jgi:HSP20 family molecular chaperone IbpA